MESQVCLNRLLGTTRAIVTAIPGTTRDLLTEELDFNGIPVTLVDTAGIHLTEDAVESAGVERARRALGVAAAVILVLDRSRPLSDEDAELLESTAETDRVIVVNKIDLPARWGADDLPPLPDAPPTASVSLRRDTDTDQVALRTVMASLLAQRDEDREAPALSNQRHVRLVKRAREALARAVEAAQAAAPEELILADLQDARSAFEEVTGKRTADDVLNEIFSRFCIGK